MSDDIWWVAARLSRHWPSAIEPVAEGSLAEMIWRALEMTPADQRIAVVERIACVDALPYSAWKALSEQSDFPVCI